MKHAAVLVLVAFVFVPLAFACLANQAMAATVTRQNATVVVRSGGGCPGGVCRDSYSTTTRTRRHHRRGR